MLTLLVVTAREPRCFTLHPDWDNWDLLARCLEKQTYRDFEIVAVTPFVDEARSTLSGRVERLTIVPPRDTPWRRARMYAICSARNTGLIYAKGDWVLTLDDGVEFEPDFLERLASWASRGFGVAVLARHDGIIDDTRWPHFEARAKGQDSIVLDEALCPFGHLTFPLKVAVDVNGYDELFFDGARGLEDMHFSRRLMQAGVKFVMDRNIAATQHAMLGYPEDIIANEDQNARCCNVAYTLAPKGRANLTPLTADEKQKFLNCMFWKDGGKCGFHGHPCAYPKWAKDGHPVGRRILLGGEQQLLDLAAERRRKAEREKPQ